jgi:hypothetical protein
MLDTYKLKTQHGLLLQAKMAPLKPSVEEEAFGKPGAKGAKKVDNSKRITYLKMKCGRENEKTKEGKNSIFGTSVGNDVFNIITVI